MTNPPLQRRKGANHLHLLISRTIHNFYEGERKFFSFTQMKVSTPVLAFNAIEYLIEVFSQTTLLDSLFQVIYANQLHVVFASLTSVRLKLK